MFNVHFVQLQVTIENLNAEQVQAITNRFALSETMGATTTLFSSDADGHVEVIVVEVSK